MKNNQLSDISLADRIRRLRVSKRISQEDRAHKLGMTQASYSNLENGKTHMTIEKVALIAELLEVPIWSLISPEGRLIQITGNSFSDTAVAYVENLYLQKEQLLREQIGTLQNEIGYLKEIIEKKLS